MHEPKPAHPPNARTGTEHGQTLMISELVPLPNPIKTTKKARSKHDTKGRSGPSPDSGGGSGGIRRTPGAGAGGAAVHRTHNNERTTPNHH